MTSAAKVFASRLLFKVLRVQGIDQAITKIDIKGSSTASNTSGGCDESIAKPSNDSSKVSRRRVYPRKKGKEVC
eukprot:Gb_20035 [translate_table: standard]